MIKSYQLDLGNGVLVNVEEKSVKNIYLRVNSVTAKVSVVAPKKVNLNTLKNFLFSKTDWIEKHQNKIKSKEIPQPKEYITGEKHFFLGNVYLLKVIEVNKNSIVFIEEESLVLQVKPNSNKEKRELALDKWYRKELSKEIEKIIFKWEPTMQVKVTEFGIKKMKTKWGTCNILVKRIWLNLELAKRSYDCLEYVVVHEMVHLLERNHTPKFHAYMTRFLPNWKQSKATLNQMPIE